ncbi:MAG: ATP-dependent DNA helicase PcrA [Peptococcaceae bacterium BICA1-7]|nr:MAG: ATP-dependent DNA helicase PcrA [Peptococcaceae bacterium BICA1-7]HBV96655.1 DNA helicase PcrA [Desulfotomaculum sp.]
MDLLGNLNESQREAVLHLEGPLLVLAGAGSGKTRVLTTRVANLIISRGVPPGRILAITFTNKAAREMKERVAVMVPDGARELWVSTFHSACMRILRRQAAFSRYTKNFTVYDDGDQQTVIKNCLKELEIDEKRFTPRSISASISQAKNKLVGPEEFEGQAYDYYAKTVSRVYSLYQERLINNNALDFDDILMVTVNLFKESPQVLKYYREKFQYIMVDEYQDTNHAQYLLVNMLAGEHRNICAVGDPDQGIYSWRGADIGNILAFEKDYPEARVITLEQNYRSTQTILDAANQVIKNNPDRKEKKLWTAAGQGLPVVIYTGDTERYEADFVAGRIERLHSRKGIKFGDMAVFYRTHAMSRALEESLMRRGIPYGVVGGLRFYDRKEIRDLIGYLRLLDNPLDRVSLARIINVPRRGVGEASLAKIIAYAEERSLTSLDALVQSPAIPGLPGKAKNACAALGKSLTELSFLAASGTVTVTELVQDLLDRTGYWAELEAEKTVESATRQENIKEFLTVTGEFDRTAEEGTLTEFLGGIALVADVDSFREESDQVALITLHSAKGLEFPVVFLIGMEEGVFPHSRSLDQPSEMYEERRLAYVGITRAKQIIYLTRCWQRTLYGSTKFNAPSRFLEEIPRHLTVPEDPMDTEDGAAGRQAAKPQSMPGSGHPLITTGASMWKGKESRPVQNFDEGEAVRHSKWGVGTVLSVKGSGESAEIKIEFPGFGTKTLMARYAPLEKV